jgi:hypothetical protein
MNPIWAIERGEFSTVPFVIVDAEEFAVQFARMRNPAGIVIKSASAGRRSDAQNRALWGVAYPLIADKTGMAKEEVHDACKAEYFMAQGGIKSGAKPISTSGMDVVEFMRYFEWIQVWAAEFLGVVIPDPERVSV